MANPELRGRSGEIDDDRELVCFLYMLMRDHLPVGTVTQLVNDSRPVAKGPFCFTNGHLAEYAQYLAGRLT
jgi:hypothetical protein